MSDSLARDLNESTELLAHEMRARRDSEREAIRLWRIATAETAEQTDALKAEVEALGSATPEACRAIDVWNHRCIKHKFIEELRIARQHVRTAQDAAVLAIQERRQFEDEVLRLTKCLAEANAGFEEYERKYYLVLDKLEEYEQKYFRPGG